METRHPPTSVTLGKIILVSTLAAVALGAAFFIDNQVAALCAYPPSEVAAIAGFLGTYGDIPGQLIVASVLLFIAAWRGSARLKRLVFCMVVASLLAGLGTLAIKNTTGRTRPYVAAEQQGWHGMRDDSGRWIVGDSPFNAFPSGHSATSTAFLGVLAFSSSRLRYLAILLLPFVPMARLFTGSHHFSDVMAGVILGIVTAATWNEQCLGPRLTDLAAKWSPFLRRQFGSQDHSRDEMRP